MSTSTLSHSEQTPSLEEIHSSVPIPRAWWRRFLAFSGPAFLVSVGYMDPGNWGTDLQAGSKFGHRLLWVLLMSNLMALLLQSLATRLGVIAGRDLAQACRETYPRRSVYGLWVLTEIAIAATDLAEVIGTVIALKLLFGAPYLLGLAICAGDTFLLLALQKRGVRLLEFVTLALISVIGVSFFIELFIVQPEWYGVMKGFVPALALENQRESLYVAIAMLGATVMPHNLYLHSALVQTRAFAQTPDGKALACKYNFLDSMLALNGAFFINAAILILAATSLQETVTGKEVKTLQDAHALLQPLWHGGLASILFAVALLASGQSSTLTGTLAGQVVMEGFVQLRVRPWVRRLLTRSLAILPAVLLLGFVGNEADDEALLNLLVLSQAVLSFQLPFAIVPLVLFTSDARRMGPFANGIWLKILAWTCAVVVVGLNITLIFMQMTEWADSLEKSGYSGLWVYGTLGPLTLALLGFLAWITFYPLRGRQAEARRPLTAPELGRVTYRRIGVAVEFADADAVVLERAAALARGDEAQLILVHVVEGPVADYYGKETFDQESRSDRVSMAALVEHLRHEGLSVRGVLGFGNPVAELGRLAREEKMDLLVMGTHGHRLLADLALGQTVAPLLHQLAIPILVVPSPNVRGEGR